MKKIIVLFFISLVILLNGCTNSNQSLISENQKLKSRVVQLGKELADKKIEIENMQDKGSESLTINYIQCTDKKRFVEKHCDLLALPMSTAIKLNKIDDNTVVKVIDTVNVDNKIWYYVEIPFYDTPANMKGYIRASNSVPYTKGKMKCVQSDVTIKKGEPIYEVNDFAAIKSTKPHKTDYKLMGRIIEKKDGFLKISCRGGIIIWIKESSITYPEI